MDIFTLADRLGEPDPRKIASLPGNILLHWKAWLSLTGSPVEITPSATPDISPKIPDNQAQQCADVMRILGQ
ncbi:hypothetical protein [Yokenella regensburgei]|uniref:hypothetical protein n=1 Tax=Yokenella regensburgei TaxID=158877 RepID=UPI001432814A|nr:hypothetical protein [Yokenella regensburgei]QIU87854.1 hypothetical protein HEC60_08265 [Yokenella regensburgei]